MTNFNEFYENQINQLKMVIPKSIIEKYDIIQCISDTDENSIYIINHKILKTNFIMKIYNNNLQESEYKILSEINHPSIPKIIDFFIYEENSISILEFFEGKTLERIIEESNSFSLERLQLLFLNICEILEFLHSKKIIHRDLKPNNIIIDKYNNVKIIDFGCSRKTDNKKNRDTSLLGTHGYASPEQYGFSQTDQRTDIYSLGILINEIVEKFNIDIDLNLKNVIDKCKRIDPDQRYSNTMDIIKDIKYPKNSNTTSKSFLKHSPYLLIPIIIILSIFFYNHNITKTYKFKSEIIEKAVSLQIGKTPENITTDDLKNITEINIWGENIISSNDDIIWESNSGDYVSLIIINGDSYFKRGEIDTLEDFKHMENLKTLTLVKQKINDISPISNLKISHLFLNDNYIEDLMPLKNMNSLYTLEVGGNPVENFEILEELTNLAELDISDTNCTSIDFLNNTKKLKLLIAKNINIENISTISKLYKLEQLNLENNNIKDIKTLSQLKNLKYLNIANNPISDVLSINSIENLNYLVMRDTNINKNDLKENIKIIQD